MGEYTRSKESHWHVIGHLQTCHCGLKSRKHVFPSRHQRRKITKASELPATLKKDAHELLSKRRMPDYLAKRAQNLTRRQAAKRSLARPFLQIRYCQPMYYFITSKEKRSLPVFFVCVQGRSHHYGTYQVKRPSLMVIGLMT